MNEPKRETQTEWDWKAVFACNICLLNNHETPLLGQKASMNTCVPDASAKLSALHAADVLMVCNSKHGANLCPPLEPLPLSSSSPSLTHHGFALLCDGARCQLVSSTCRRGSLVQASAGCEIGHLTFVHDLCMPPRRPKHVRTEAQIRCYDLKLTFMVWPPCVVEAHNPSRLGWVLKTNPYIKLGTLP